MLAIIRIVLKIEARTNDDNHEWFDSQVSTDRGLLEQAINRGYNNE